MEQIEYFSYEEIHLANQFLQELHEKKIEYRLEFCGKQYGFNIIIIYKKEKTD